MAKTKTERLIQILESEEYQRKPQPFMKKDKLTVRAYILGQYGMLQCAANFSTGYGSKNCKTCNVIDNDHIESTTALSGVASTCVKVMKL